MDCFAILAAFLGDLCGYDLLLNLENVKDFNRKERKEHPQSSQRKAKPSLAYPAPRQ